MQWSFVNRYFRVHKLWFRRHLKTNKGPKALVSGFPLTFGYMAASHTVSCFLGSDAELSVICSCLTECFTSTTRAASIISATLSKPGRAHYEEHSLLGIFSSRLAGTALCTIQVSQIPRWECSLWWTRRESNPRPESFKSIRITAINCIAAVFVFYPIQSRVYWINLG